MSSENHELNVSLSLLYSILYAPLIYYHNIAWELQNSEMISLQAFVDLKGEAGAKAKGAMQVEGKDYVVRDGDVMHFRTGA
jgi:ribosome-binding ATPase YchF (GTP1/OBG family)